MNFLAQTQLGDGSAFSFMSNHPFIFVALLAWSLVWKGLALWKSARLSHKWWFIVILLANTIGIIEIIYIYFIARKYTVEAEVEAESEKVK